MSEKIKKPDLKSHAYMAVSCEKEFDIFSLEMTRNFSIIIQPYVEDKNTIEIKPNDNYEVQFNYLEKKGLSIKKICKGLEDMAAKIREHYK